MSFGERLRKAIEFEGLSVSEFSELTGISLSNLSHLMSGQRLPSFKTLATMIRSLPTADLDWLILDY